MARIAQSIQLDPARMSASAKAQLAEELFQVHDAIFAGTDLATFTNLVMAPPAERSSLLLHRDENGRLVGYCTMHRFRRQIGGRTCSVLRAQSGLYKAFRGKNSNITFLMRQVMFHWLQHPLRPLYFFGLMLHPSSYAVLHRFSHHFWPAPGQDERHPLAAKAYELFASFNITPVSPDRPFIANLGILTRENKDDQQFWQNSTKPSDRFFLSVNPGYRQGDGLLALVPLSPLAVGHALVRWLKMRKQKRAR